MRSSAPAQKRSSTPRGSRSACGCLSTCPLPDRYRQPEPSSGTDRTTASRSATKTVVGSRRGSLPNRIEPTEWTTWTTGSMSTAAVPIAERPPIVPAARGLRKNLGQAEFPYPLSAAFPGTGASHGDSVRPSSKRDGHLRSNFRLLHSAVELLLFKRIAAATSR
jgi:hypothetical protein